MHRFIEELDLRRFMIKEEVDIIFPMIDVAETGNIDRKTLTDWVVSNVSVNSIIIPSLN